MMVGVKPNDLNILLISRPAAEAFKTIRARTRKALDDSRKKIEEVDEGLRAEYNQIETARVEYDEALKQARDKGTPLPDPTGVELRSAETLRVDLDAQKTGLELHLNTNPGVIEQYERRQAEVGYL